MKSLNQVEERLGLIFVDKSLLQRALTHRSYLNEHPDLCISDNERLEFLGDAVLDFVTGAHLYHRFPELDEGVLTSLRSALVRRETLARFAQDLDLGDHMLMGHGEDESGGRQRAATLCAVFEAVIGAVYLDQGLGAVEALVYPLIEPEVAGVLRERSDRDAKSLLQEYAQAHLRCTPRYSTVSEVGPDHAKEFTVEVRICGTVCGRGTGRNKQTAAQAAAAQALELCESGELLFSELKSPSE